MHLSENDVVLISVCEPLNYIHQDTKSARLSAVCKRSITLNKFGKRAKGCCVHVFLVCLFIYLYASTAVLIRGIGILALVNSLQQKLILNDLN